MTSQRTNRANHFTSLLLTIALAALTLPCTAGETLHYIKREHPCMGTLFYLHLHTADVTLANAALDKAIARIDEINQLASDYLPESELSKLNRAPAHQPVSLNPDLYQLLHRSSEISTLSEGAFDITAAYAIQNWRRAKRQQQLPTRELTAKAIAHTDWRALQLDHQRRTVTKTKSNLLIDLGGIAKGYAADAALTILKQHGITRALIAASGDLAIGDPPPGESGWPVSLKLFENLPAGLTPPPLHLQNCAVSTSGDLHQSLELGGKRYSHIIDPATGLGLTRRTACAFISPNAATSDGLATAACILGPEKTQQLLAAVPGASVYLIQIDPLRQVILGPAFKR